MKKELNPAVMYGVIALVVMVLCSWGYKSLQAPGYEPSPGTGGAPAISGYSGQPSQAGAQTASDPRGPNMPPPNAVPGVMRSQK